MNKSLLVIAGIVLLAVPSVHAQNHVGLGRSAGINRRAAFNHPSAFYGGARFAGHGHGYRGHGRYYYLGGVPYFYPYFDYGFGYPYYGGGFGYGYATSYYGGFYGDMNPSYYGAPPYEGQVIEQGASGKAKTSNSSLPTAVQRQLAKRGYYKATIDGQFGDSSRSALRRFQRDNHLKDTGRIDEPSLEALGFSDRH